MQTPPGDKIVEASVALAEAWQNRANELLTVEEKGIAQQMQRLVTHPMWGGWGRSYNYAF